MKIFSRTVLSDTRTDEIYIPREVMSQKNISNNTKLIFGTVFSDCLSKMESIDENTASQAANVIRNFGSTVSLDTIEKECLCGTETAKLIQKELSSLTATLDIEACFYECELNYMSVHKPVCLICNNGKIIYKMLDLINTLVDRQLHNADFNKLFSDDELKTLDSYSKDHSSELLNEVIDIMKR